MPYRSWRLLCSWTVLSALLGFVLLAAAALKGHEIATTELLEGRLLYSRWFLIVAVEWETFFALWLLGGFYRFYPQTTYWVSLLYFFALFVVAMDSVLRGSPSCPCFGKASVPPWIPAAFDLVVVIFLAAASPSLWGRLQQRPRWISLASVFSVFGLLGLITMVDYSTSGAVFSIRSDPRLVRGAINVQRVRPKTEELVAIVRSATDLNLTVDDRLLTRQPDYGVWDMKRTQPWTVMELLAAHQSVPARWAKVEDGYAMVPAAPFGKSQLFWFGSAAILCLSMMGLRWRDVIQERKKALSSGIDRQTRSVAGLRAARCR